MITNPPNYHRYRFPPDIISHAVWLYHRFCLSFRDVEDLLAQRGITVSYETIRQWCRKFGAEYARRLRHRRSRLGDIWHLDELFVTIQGQRQYLWRAVDQDRDFIDVPLQSHRDQHAAQRFFRKLLKDQGRVPWRLVTDKLRSYRAAHRTVMPSVIHNTELSFDCIRPNRAFFDIDQWISTLAYAIVVFDSAANNMAIFDQGKGVSTDEA